MATDVVHTLKSTAGDYSLISTWEAAEQRDLTLATGVDETETLDCYKGTTVVGGWQPDGSLADIVQVGGWVADATHKITVQAASTERHGGVVGAGFVMAITTANTMFFITQSDLQMKDMGFSRPSGSQGGRFIHFSTDSNRGLVERCWFDANGLQGISIEGTDPYSSTVRNCLAMGGTDSSAFNFYFRTNSLLENCTAINNNEGFSVDGSSATNCVAYGSASNDYFGSVTGSNNASGDGTAPGTNPTTGITSADFVDYAGGDYSPAPAGQLDGAGADLSGTFTDDIASNTRVAPWEIGAYEIADAPEPTITFSGPDIADQTGTNSVPFSMSQVVSDSFTVQNGTASYALGPNSNALPPGLTVNSTTGNIEGTPTQDGTYANIIVRGNDAAAAGPVLQQNLWQDSDIAGTSGSVTFPVTPTSGNLLIAALTVDKDSGAITIPAGWTLIGTAEFGNTVSGAFAYKISDGTEGAVAWTWTNSEASHVIWISEYSGITALDVFAEADSADADVTSQTTGTTAANTADNSLAVAIWGADTSSNVDNGPAYTNGFTELHPFDPGALVGMAIATKILTGTAAVESTFTTTGTGDAMYGKVAVFK